ncbi:hypothetical protein LCGC14_1521620, partial [marine sediment metagenome]
ADYFKGNLSSIEIAMQEVLDNLNTNYISQHPIGWYIVDFYLPEQNLIVECDGDYWHNRSGVQERDAKRDSYLRRKGYKVVRIWEHEIKKDAKNAFDSGNFEEFIRFYFLSIEKLTEVFHLKIFRKDLKTENGKIIDDLIEDIVKKIEIPLVDINEFKYWRRIRNNIIHQNLKIDKDRADKGKEFFDELYRKMSKSYIKYDD